MSDVIYGLAGPPPDPPAITGKFRPFGEGGFSFKALLDVINPLQHIPVVSSAYRAMSGEEIGFVPRVLGGALFGGPIGLVAALVNAIVKEASGRDLGETAVALVTDDASSYVASHDPAKDTSPSVAALGVSAGITAGPAAAMEARVNPEPPAKAATAGQNAAADARLLPARAPVMPGTAQAGPLLHFRVPSVAAPTTSAAAKTPRSEPTAAEIPDRSPEWFMRSISRGLEKYDRASRLDRGENGTAKTRIDG